MNQAKVEQDQIEWQAGYETGENGEKLPAYASLSFVSGFIEGKAKRTTEQ